MINIQDATPQQIAWFKLGAARRYQALGVEPVHAEQLFNTKMAAVGAALGVDGTQHPVSGRVPAVKVAEAMKRVVAGRKQ